MQIKGRKSKKLIVANWKMHPATLGEAMRNFDVIKKAGAKATGVQTVVSAPFIYLESLKRKVTGHRVVIGAQDCHSEREGAYTGEVSPYQLQALGVEYVILGHSERRALGETNEMISHKVDAALKAGLRVVLCVGETKRDPAGNFIEVLKNQIKESLDRVPRKYFLNLIVCYEPIWAISAHALPDFKGETPEDILEMSIFVRKQLGSICGKDLADKVAVIYGGSVDPKNVGSFLRDGGVDGALVGSASLTPTSFVEIIQIADNMKE